MYREYVPCTRNLLQFQADPFETLHTLLEWSEDMHIVFLQNPEIIFYHFLLHF